MSRHASRQPRLTPAEQANLLPPPKPASTSASPLPPPAAPQGQSAAGDLLPPELDLPPGTEPTAIEPPEIQPPGRSTEVTTAWSPGDPSLRPASIAKEQPPTIQPLISAVQNPAIRRLSPEQRAQFRFWKNGILFGFFVGVLLLIFWLLAQG